MNNPKLSIIIATFNAAKTLNVALDSVLNQTFQDWECVIVDGASKDNTIDVVKSYVERDSRIRYISEPDKGIYDAFNKGWKMAKGEWIYYLGADDELLKDGISQMFGKEIRSDIIYGDIVLDTGLRTKFLHSLAPNELWGDMISHQAILMKRKILEDFGGFNESYKICADFDLMQRLLIAQCEMQHFNSFVAIFNCSGISGSQINNLKEAYQIRRKYKTKNNTILYIEYIYSLFLNNIKYLIKKVLMKLKE